MDLEAANACAARPDGVEDGVGGHEASGLEEQERENSPKLRPAKMDAGTIDVELERPQGPEDDGHPAILEESSSG